LTSPVKAMVRQASPLRMAGWTSEVMAKMWGLTSSSRRSASASSASSTELREQPKYFRALPMVVS